MKNLAQKYICKGLMGFKNTNEPIYQEDIISVVKFNHEGSILGLGDKSGRVILFKFEEGGKVTYFHEFSAHFEEFDCLNSTNVSEEIRNMVWLTPQNNYQKLLTMNEKNITMWKIFECPQKKMTRVPNNLILPKFQSEGKIIRAVSQKIFPNYFEEPLVTMDVFRNEQFLLCCDTLKTFIWDMQKPKIPYCVADLQGNLQPQEVKEHLSCLRSHPTSDNQFAYGTNRGKLFLSDCRCTDNSNKNCILFSVKKTQKQNTFTQLISSQSDIQFLDEKHIASRGYLTVKIWDLAKTDKPVMQIPVQDSLKNKLTQIFDNDSIFDKFSLCKSYDSSMMMTGNYNNCFNLISTKDGNNTQFQINLKKKTILRAANSIKITSTTKINYARKTLAMDFHPRQHHVAVASLNGFSIYGI